MKRSVEKLLRLKQGLLARNIYYRRACIYWAISKSRTARLDAVIRWQRPFFKMTAKMPTGWNADKSAMDSLESVEENYANDQERVSGRSGWMVLTRAIRISRKKNHKLAAGDRKGATNIGLQGWFLLVSFYEHCRLVARLSKCEITLCIGKTRLLWLTILNSETYRHDSCTQSVGEGFLRMNSGRNRFKPWSRQN